MKGQILKEGKRGFTLVELIVVIAILAILAAVAYPVYNGYIDYTNKGVDRQTVGEIIHAIELADYSDPTLFGDNPNGIVLLSSNGAVGTTPAIQKAINDAGINAALSYEKWPGSIPAKEAANLVNTALDSLDFLDGENVNLTYVGVATQSWDAVKDAVGKVTALLSSGEFGKEVSDVEKNAPALVLAAAKAASTPSASLDWVNFNPSADNKTESLPSIVARNYSFAEYLRQNYNYDGIEDDIESLQNVLVTFNALLTNDYKDPFADSSNTNLYTAAQAYLNNKVGGTDFSQAQIDNKGYNQMMKSMYDRYQDQLDERVEDGKTYYEFKGNASAFWDEAGGFLSTAGQMAQMTEADRQAFINNLPEEGTAIQVVIKGRNADGTLNVSAIPADAMPTIESTGSGGCSHEHSPATLEIDASKSANYTVELCMTAGVTECTLNAINNTNNAVFTSTQEQLNSQSGDTLETTLTGALSSYYTSIKITAKNSGTVTLSIQSGRYTQTIYVVIYP